MAREAGSGLRGKRETGGGSAGAAGSVSGAAWPGPVAHTWRRGEPCTCRGPPQCHLNSHVSRGDQRAGGTVPPIHGSLNAPRWRREASRGPQRQFQTVLVVPWFTQLSAVLALLFKRQKMRQRRRSAIFQCQPRGILCPYFISSPFLRLHTTLLTRLPTHHSPCSLPVPIPSPFTNHHLSPSSFPIFFPKICHLAPPRTY